MKYMLFQKDCQVLRKLLIEAAPFSWTSMGALPLPGSEARLQGFQVHSSHHIDNAQKQTGLGVFQHNLTGKRVKRRDGVRLPHGSGCAGSLDQMDAGG